MDEFTLKKAKSTELKDVLSLYLSVIGQTGCAWNRNYPNEEDVQNDYDLGNLYVLKKYGIIIGALSVVFENELDDMNCWRVKNGAHREIARVVVSREYQGKGYAKIMLNKMIFALLKQGCSSIHLLAATENTPAVKMYEALGFELLGECKRHGMKFSIFEKILI